MKQPLSTLIKATLWFCALAIAPTAISAPSKPNIVLILMDDLGYGDLSVQGHPLIRTPNIDQLASEGQRWTSFYASAPICGPSREALMTGRMPIRIHNTGLNSWEAMPHSEITLGELLKGEGYNTAYIGKWGLADLAFGYQGAHPNEQGFDYYYGLAHSNDGPLRKGLYPSYANIKNAKSADINIALYRQRDVIERPAHQPTLTQRYTEESVQWIEAQGDKPFFLYLSHSMPHVPLFVSPAFKGRSKAGIYGDVVEELDWSVGQVLQALDKAGVSGNTLVIVSSDNGPWRTYYDLAGSPGPWRDGKQTGWEGAYRVPGIFRWPGKIQPAVIRDIGVNVDLMATIATLTDTPLPKDRRYDALDLSRTLLKGKPSPRNEWFFYGPMGKLMGARVGDYKLVYESKDSVGKDNLTKPWDAYQGDTEAFSIDRGYSRRQIHNPPLLFNLATDNAERLNIADEHSDIIADVEKAVGRHQQSLSLTGEKK